MSRPIDHVVLPVRDLDRSAQYFMDLGFQVGGRNRHPWGTENRIVQLPGVFLELITLGHNFVLAEATDDTYPFAGFVADALANPGPSTMLALRSDDHGRDTILFKEHGVGQGRTLSFSRQSVSAVGEIRTVSFSLAFAHAGSMPDVGFFTCQHHRPEHFWNEALQQHPNTVMAFSGLVLVADDPSIHTETCSILFDVQPQPIKNGFRYDLGPHTVEIVTRQDFLQNTKDGQVTRSHSKAFVAALRFRLENTATISLSSGSSLAGDQFMAGTLLVRGPEPASPSLIFEPMP